MMRGNSGQRLPLTISGDLDGHVFQLSSDGQWLLYSREVTNNAASFNSLWVVPTMTITPTRTVTRTNPGGGAGARHQRAVCRMVAGDSALAGLYHRRPHLARARLAG